VPLDACNVTAATYTSLRSELQGFYPVHDHVDVKLGVELPMIKRSPNPASLTLLHPALQRRATHSLAAQHTGSLANGAPAQRRVGSPVFRYHGNAARSYVHTLNSLSIVSPMTAVYAARRSRS
jgi:hypothetical protein